MGISSVDVTIEFGECASSSESSNYPGLSILWTDLLRSTKSSARDSVEAVSIHKCGFDPCLLVGNVTNLKSSEPSGTALQAPLVSEIILIVLNKGQLSFQYCLRLCCAYLMVRKCCCRPKLAYISAGLCISSHTAYVEETSRGQPRYDLQIRFLSLFTHPKLKTEVENGSYTACIT